MEEIILNIENRQLSSKGYLKKLRKSNRIPGVLYGSGIKSEAVSVLSKDFMTIIGKNGINMVICLKLNGEKKTVIIKSLQKDIFTKNFIHIDFQMISLFNKIEVSVPINIIGEFDKVKNFDSSMEIMLREIKIKVLAKNIPQRINVDINMLNIAKKITVADLPKIDGLEYVQEPSTLIINVVKTVKKNEQTTTDEIKTKTNDSKIIDKDKKN
ncbi:MAG: 50S ribosomal protein L25 [Endomicrobium sp.]|nr:50S ribosomal protein L25 [Endomicrobium sp.]